MLALCILLMASWRLIKVAHELLVYPTFKLVGTQALRRKVMVRHHTTCKQEGCKHIHCALQHAQPLHNQMSRAAFAHQILLQCTICVQAWLLQHR